MLFFERDSMSKSCPFAYYPLFLSASFKKCPGAGHARSWGFLFLLILILPLPHETAVGGLDVSPSIIVLVRIDRSQTIAACLPDGSFSLVVYQFLLRSALSGFESRYPFYISSKQSATPSAS